MVPRKSILVVDDEEDIRELLGYNLTKSGFDVRSAADGESAIEMARAQTPDVILLDLMLPGIDGCEVCYRLRSDDALKHVPIIMLTAKTEETDQVIGLRMGADDYITKPFSVRVLTARINAVLRRAEQAESADGDADEVVVRGELVIDPGRHEVTWQGELVALTPVEFRILHFLARTPGRVHTRKRIIDDVQGEEVFITERTVDVHMVSLRRKLGACARNIETVRGVGYRYKD